MKKFLLALACVALAGQGLFAQDAQEITYVEDCSQGYLFNRFKDNWFVSAEGGINMFYSPGDSKRDWKNRWEPQAAIYVGKWFSPLLGVRAGVSWLKVKGLSEIADTWGVVPNDGMVDGYYKQKFVHIGPAFDAMLDITNWLRGYHPGRKYHLTAYLGTGFYYTFARRYEADGNDWDVSAYKNSHDKILMARAGIINSLRLGKGWQIDLDIRLTSLDNHMDQADISWNKTAYDLSANLGVTYLFNEREWRCPIVPVCPEPENCDEYRAALQAAQAQIGDLESQLKNSLARPAEVVKDEPAPAPLATIYYPINVYRLTREDIRIVNAVAEVMKATPDTKYVVTGWADNYTGNDRINTALRKNRAASVEKQLLKAGVPASQFTTTINNANLVDMGEKFVALDRATTIQIAK